MPVIDKATGRVVAVIVLLIVVAAALHGYLPGVERAPRHEPPRGSASLLYVLALLAISLVIVGAAVIARLRDPRTPATSAGNLPDRFGGGAGRPGWRILLIGAAVLVGWLLLVWLLTRFFGPSGVGQLPDTTAPNTQLPTGETVPPPEQPREPDSDEDVLGYLVVSTVALLVLLVGGGVVAARRRRGTAPRIAPVETAEPPVSTAASETLVRAAEVGLSEVGDLSREPREAIIACYAAMERELAKVPDAAPQEFDTPTEVLARAVEHRALHADNAAQLVQLFAEARFSRHVMNEGHRQTAADVLQLVLAELRSLV